MISLIALMVALGGAAYAVKVAPKNSVKSKSVKNESLKGKDIKDGKLTGADVNGNSLDGSDIDEKSLAQVPEAANADTVDGHSAECPPATVEHLGWCYDSAGNPADHVPRRDGRLQRQGRQPADARPAAQHPRPAPGSTSSDPDVHWADGAFQSPAGTNRAMTFSDASVDRQ